jgi:hypothetical protein
LPWEARHIGHRGGFFQRLPSARSRAKAGAAPSLREDAAAFTGEVPVTEFSLVAHADRPATGVRAIDVTMQRNADNLLIEYRVHGIERLVLPPVLPLRGRQDGLWKTTCFEVFFLDSRTNRYVEFNFSPSLCWAAYAFTSYRDGMSDLPLPVDPYINFGDQFEPFVLIAEVALSAVPPSLTELSFTAVIEADDGTKSFWALAHPDGPPDFHNRDCFVATLPAPPAP